MTDTAAPVAGDAGAVAARVHATFGRVQRERMAGLPFVNEALRVELVGLRRWRGLWLGALVTPWFMNLLLLPGDGEGTSEEPPARWPRVATGEYAQFAFPAGTMSFLAGREGEVGEYLSCSLFSPMFEFADHETARQTAAACLVALFDSANGAPATSDDATAKSPAQADAAPASASKRDFLRGGRRSAAAAKETR
jgi:[NiFe] hydrogenase assembly HybE family chaperone